MTVEDPKTSAIGPLPPSLQARLDVIIRAIPKFWDQQNYKHFTNQGAAYSERVYRLLAQLAQELPEGNRLNADEIFIVSAAVWLYETGVQSPNLKPVLDFENKPNKAITVTQLQTIREKKHLLSKSLIYDSIRDDYKGKPLNLGLLRPADKHTFLIAEVCRWISDEPIETAPEDDIVDGVTIRIRLLVALLRLADQLYIDSSRVNLDLLDSAHLPDKTFARWWAYHYTQALPITNGQIRFHYFLPSHQKEYLGHIRALIEPIFEFDNNPTIRYLWEHYRLRLMPPRKPSVSRFDQAPGFQRPMSPDLINILRREVTPIPTPLEEVIDESEEEPKERCLLALDFENFLLQLGQDGFFFDPNEMGRLIARLRTEANQEHNGKIDCIAVGHWNRPDLKNAAKMLEARVFDLVTVGPNDDKDHKLIEILEEKIQDSQKPKRVILVTPSIGLGRLVQRLVDNGFLVNTWTSNLADAEIFHGGFGNKYKILSNLLELGVSLPISQIDLEKQTAIFIYRIQAMQAEDMGNKDKNVGLTLDRLISRLEHIDLVTTQLDWWLQWLIESGILLTSQPDSTLYYHLNLSNPTIVLLNQKKDIVINVFKDIAPDNKEVGEYDVLEALKSASAANFRQEESTRRFLGILKEEEILRRRDDPYAPDGPPFWQLNDKHGETIGDHLPQFLLALDHALARQGFYEFHEHTLDKQLSQYFDDNLISPLLQSALMNGWIRRLETDNELHHGKGKVFLIGIEEYHPDAGIVIRNRNLILQYMKNRVDLKGINQSLLWERLKEQVKAFTLDRAGFEVCIDQMHKDGILSEAQSATGDKKSLMINLDARVTQRLFGRQYLFNLVKSLRTLRATKENKQLLEKIKELLLRHATSNDPLLVDWTIEFAKIIRLIGVEDSVEDGKVQTFVWLNRHSFVRSMDNREKIVCEELPKIASQLSRDRDGWIPRPIVFSEMNKGTDFGPSRIEHEFWLNQALWRKVIEQERRKDARGDPNYLRAVPKKK